MFPGRLTFNKVIGLQDYTCLHVRTVVHIAIIIDALSITVPTALQLTSTALDGGTHSYLVITGDGTCPRRQ